MVATVKGGQRFSGILSAATADGEVNLALRQAQLVDDPSAPLRPSLLIQAKDLQELSAVDISLDSRPSERDAFKTDTEVTGLASDRREKELQAWGAGTGLGGDGGIEDSLGGLSLDDEQRGQGGGKAWDQFATNERLYGTRTDYHEELYTTKLDRSGADYRQREQRAAQLEREILKVRSRTASTRTIIKLTALHYREEEVPLPTMLTSRRSAGSSTIAVSLRRIGMCSRLGARFSRAKHLSQQLLWCYSWFGGICSARCSQDGPSTLGCQWLHQWVAVLLFPNPRSRPYISFSGRISCFRSTPRPVHHFRHVSSARRLQHFEDSRRRAGLHHHCSWS